MSIEDVKNNKTMMCDKRGCHEFIEEPSFKELISTAHRREWKIFKSSTDKWTHYCPDCK